MTLLEALTALVILGASAAGFLGVFQTAARSVQSAAAWNSATSTAAAALDQAVRGDEGLTEQNVRVESRPWSAKVNDVVVQVRMPDGRMLTVHRLVRQK